MAIIPSGGGGGATNYADMMLRQLANIGKPLTTTTRSDFTTTGPEQGMDFATLAMLLYFMLGNKGSDQTQSGGNSFSDLFSSLLGGVGSLPK